MKEVYVKSLEGIVLAIKKRQDRLKRLRQWYNNPSDAGNTTSFYRIGIQCTSEIKQLKAISNDLYYLIKHL